MQKELVTMNALMLGLLEDRDYSTGQKEADCWCLSCGAFPPFLSSQKTMKRRWRQEASFARSSQFCSELSFHQK